MIGLQRILKPRLIGFTVKKRGWIQGIELEWLSDYVKRRAKTDIEINSLRKDLLQNSEEELDSPKNEGEVYQCGICWDDVTITKTVNL